MDERARGEVHSCIELSTRTERKQEKERKKVAQANGTAIDASSMPLAATLSPDVWVSSNDSPMRISMHLCPQAGIDVNLA